MYQRMAVLTIVCTALFSMACQGKLEKIDKTCERFQKISTMIDDCPGMGKALAKTSDDFSEIIDCLRESKDSDEMRRQYIQSLSSCTRSLLDISTGPCRNDESVRRALSEIQH